jgi:hypothetical protein
MTTISHGPQTIAPQTRRWPVELTVREMWASLAITAIWVAVAVTAIWGSNITTISAGGDGTNLPSAVAVAFFAFFATWVVAKHGFRGERKD